jgi:Cu-processing system permease protein
MMKIAKYVVLNILRSKIILAYTVFLFAVAMGMFGFESDVSKSIASLMSIVLIIIPLVSIIFTTIYFYNSSEFIELLMAQPISRRKIYFGEYIGVSISMLCAYFIGIAVPVLIYSADGVGLTLISSGACLTMAFVSLAFFASVLTRDKAKGIGISLMIWFYFSIIYDAIVLSIMFAFSDYPLERIMILLSSLNPIDLSRILILLKLDISALMGFTGAVYKDFFGNANGIIFSIALQMVWIVLPAFLGYRIFRRKNW